MRFCLICSVSWEKEFSFSSSIRLLLVACRKERAGLNYEWALHVFVIAGGSEGAYPGHTEREETGERALVLGLQSGF